MSERKLASVMTVKEVADIAGKDRIGYVSFLETGWQVIGNKELKPGDKVVYLEYDSIIPEKSLEYLRSDLVENLKKRCWSAKRNGCVIHCMKMAGQVSYGILFEQKDFVNFDIGIHKAGTDLTKGLGIYKIDDDVGNVTVQEKRSAMQKWYDVIMWKVFKKKRKKVLGSWPPFLQKTDETRVQALPPDTVNSFKGKKVYISEKIDGQSVTFAIYKKNFYVCSRNMVIYMKPIKKAMKELIPQKMSSQTDKYLASACKYDIPGSMYRYNKCPSIVYGADFAMQAEQAGPGIQKNPCKLGSVELFVFNVFNIKERRYYGISALKRIVNGIRDKADTTAANLQTVPILHEKLILEWETIRDLEKLAKGPTFNGEGKNREGIVIRRQNTDITEIYVEEPPKGCSNMASMKVINPDYILNNKEE